MQYYMKGPLESCKIHGPGEKQSIKVLCVLLKKWEEASGKFILSEGKKKKTQKTCVLYWN